MGEVLPHLCQKGQEGWPGMHATSNHRRLRMLVLNRTALLVLERCDMQRALPLQPGSAPDQRQPWAAQKHGLAGACTLTAVVEDLATRSCCNPAASALPMCSVVLGKYYSAGHRNSVKGGA